MAGRLKLVRKLRATCFIEVEDAFHQVLKGLKAGERVVTSGQFMLDSESQLREAIQKMLQPQASPPVPSAPTEFAPPSGHSGHQMTSPAGKAVPAVESISFICPMPEHLSIKYEHAGKCPICGMDLIPVSNEMLANLPPGGKVDHYTCPMPEHADVKASKPGKCPRCGMTLIPVMTSPASQTAPDAPVSPPRHQH